MNHQAGLEYERSFWDQGKHVVGIDEAGRGPIAGPLVVAGAVFDIGYTNSEIYDSKALSEKKREKLFSLILREARCYKIKIVTPEEIDTLNIYRATQKAMEEIACEINAEAVLTDAMPLLHCAKRRCRSSKAIRRACRSRPAVFWRRSCGIISCWATIAYIRTTALPGIRDIRPKRIWKRWRNTACCHSTAKATVQLPG